MHSHTHTLRRSDPGMHTGTYPPLPLGALKLMCTPYNWLIILRLCSLTNHHRIVYKVELPVFSIFNMPKWVCGLQVSSCVLLAATSAISWPVVWTSTNQKLPLFIERLKIFYTFLHETKIWLLSDTGITQQHFMITKSWSQIHLITKSHWSIIIQSSTSMVWKQILYGQLSYDNNDWSR